MKTILRLALLTILVNFIGCSTNEDENSTPEKVLKFKLNGQLVDFYENTTESDYASTDAHITNDKQLRIQVSRNGLTLNLNIGEIFLETPIMQDTYKIGTLQDDLETNILLSDANDNSYVGGTSTYQNYSAIYGCNVLSSEQVGEITITELDTENKMVSGTFEGTLFRWIDLSTAELKTIEITNGVFTLPYYNREEELDASSDRITARVNGFRFDSDNTISNAHRSMITGVDKIEVSAYDHNFGWLKLAMESNVQAGNTYVYQPTGYAGSLGVRFQNRINMIENFTTHYPDRSNDSYIYISSHDPEANTIEGTFYVENCEIEGRTIEEGYFKAAYVDNIE